MTKEIVENLIKFMDRVQLSGKEVPAWCECINELHKLREALSAGK